MKARIINGGIVEGEVARIFVKQGIAKEIKPIEAKLEVKEVKATLETKELKTPLATKIPAKKKPVKRKPTKRRKRTKK